MSTKKKTKHKSPRRMSKQQLQRIFELHSQGVIPYRIAKTLAIPPGVVRYHLDRMKSAGTQRALKLSDFIDEEDVNDADSAYLKVIRDLREKNERLVRLVADSLIQ